MKIAIAILLIILATLTTITISINKPTEIEPHEPSCEYQILMCEFDKGCYERCEDRRMKTTTQENQ